MIQNIYTFVRSNHRRCSMREGVLRNFAKFTEKHLFQSLFFNKVAGQEFCEIAKNASGRLLLFCYELNDVD